jgi:16S rRNA G966 N2-methylase RsmD
MTIADEGLFDYEAPPPVSLADKFGVPPISVLDRRSGDWQARKRRWLSLGIQSELGRAAAAVGITAAGRTDFLAELLRSGETIGALNADGISVFDPVVCELAYRWHTLPGDRILDPFAGGSVRGVVASILARYYVGVDIRTDQVEANQGQAGLGSDIQPRWIQGDAQRIDDSLASDDEFDLVFSCPPYGDLERYSDNPRDLSAMSAEDFDAAHRSVIQQTSQRLRNDRFAVWVISDVRDRRGAYRGLVADTIGYFASAGLRLHNDAVLLDQVGTAAVRAERPFRSSRKLTRVHQHMLVFIKGNATNRCIRRGLIGVVANLLFKPATRPYVHFSLTFGIRPEPAQPVTGKVATARLEAYETGAA